MDAFSKGWIPGRERFFLNVLKVIRHFQNGLDKTAGQQPGNHAAAPIIRMAQDDGGQAAS